MKTLFCLKALIVIVAFNCLAAVAFAGSGDLSREEILVRVLPRIDHARVANLQVLDGLTWTELNTMLIAPELVSPPNGATLSWDLSYDFTWNSVAGGNLYELELSEVDTSLFLEATPELHPQVLYIPIQFGGEGSFTLHWRVRAYDNDGAGPWSEEWSFNLSSAIAPPAVAPMLLSPSDAAVFLVGQEITFGWDAVFGALGYEIQFDNGSVIDQYDLQSYATSIQQPGEHTWQVRAYNQIGPGPWSESRIVLIVEEGLIGYWSLDEAGGDIANDLSGNDHSGTVVGGPIWGDGVCGLGLSFDGIDDFIDLPVLYEQGPSSLTVGLWLNLTSENPTFEKPIYHGDNGEWEYVIEEDTLWCQVKLTDGVWHRLRIERPAPQEWHYVAMTWQRGEWIALYVDGDSCCQELVPDLPLFDPGPSWQAAVATYRFLPNTRYFFNGSVDEVKVFDRVLSYAEIIDEYNRCHFACGDTDGSGQLDLADAIYLVNYIFGHGGPPLDEAGGDLNCDGKVSMSDIVYLVWYIFSTGHAPCDPSGDGSPDC